MSATTIAWEDFVRVDLRVGTVTEVKAFPEARKPAYRLIVDLGPELGLKRSSAQITDHYTAGELVGRQVIVVVNLAPKRIGPFVSECLVTGFFDERGWVRLAVPDGVVPNGARLA